MAVHDEDLNDEDAPHDEALEAERADEEIVHIRGASGVVWPMALPLHEAIQDQVAKGEAVRVNEDGSPWEPSEDDPELVAELDRDRAEREHRAALEYAELKRERPDEDPIVLRDEAAEVHGDPIPEGAPKPGDVLPPKVAAPKTEWVDFAVEEHGVDRDDAESMTKADLVKKFG
jgi:hypothetical protein